MPKARELRDERAQLWERAKEILDKAEAESRNLDAAEKENWNKTNADIEALSERIDRQELLERMPAKQEERGVAGRIETAVLSSSMDRRTLPEYRAAFLDWVRYGGVADEHRNMLMPGWSAGMPSPERRALSIANATGAGFLVPEEYERSIDQAMVWFGGMREVASIFRTDSGADIPFPTSNDTGNTGRILNENTAAAEQDVTVGVRMFKAYMYSSDMVRVSLQLLQDSAFDIEGWLRDILAERIGRITNTHFTTGQGANLPSGIVPDAFAGVTAAGTATIAWDELIDLEHQCNIAYRRQGARYMLHDLTLRELKQLKDGNGQYLWKPGVVSGDPNTINGYPYTVNNDMAQLATGARTVLFGLLSKYKIRDVRGIELLRFNERYGEFLQVAFLAFSRHDGALIDAGGNPVVALTQA